MPRRKRRSARRRGLVLASLAIAAAAALAWMLWPAAPTRQAEPGGAPVIAPSGPRETIEDADREALRHLLERKRSR